MFTCDPLLRLAEAGIYRPVWSEEILDEVRRNLVARIGLTPVDAGHRIDEMNAAFPDAMTEGGAALLASVPASVDEGDRHVVATAIRARAQVIVTDNRRHFPDADLEAFDIDVQGSDEFLVHEWGVRRMAATRVIGEMLADLGRTPSEHARAIEARLPGFAQLLRDEETELTPR
jgi:hypothetical protein